MRAAALLVALAVATAGAGQEPVDPDDLAAMLADLEASGGIVTADDLAAFEVVGETPARGSWSVSATGRTAAAPRAAVLAERRASGWSFRLRTRQDGGGIRAAGWMRAELSALTADLGGGAMVHGAGLLAAPPGRRSSLAPDTSLMPPRAGWRPSTATDPTAVVRGGALGWRHGRGELVLAAGRDGEGRRALLVRAEAAPGPLRAAALALRRGDSEGFGTTLAWRQGGWRLAAELAGWRLGPQAEIQSAWHLAAGWRGERWRAEGQAAASRATDGLEGAARPACLSGWRGRGWALRVATRPAERLWASLALGQGTHRDPSAATGALGDRSQLGLQLRGVTPGGPVWELRLRRTDERRRSFDPLQPWLPAAQHDHRRRTWLTMSVSLPAATGEGRLAWRRLEEDARSRQLLTAIWSDRTRWGRWRVGVQLAWGEALDLVAVSAPVPGLVRLRHWGFWRSGFLAGVDGGVAWRWQCGGELRRRSAASGGGPAVEIHAGWGRSFQPR